MPLFGMGAPRPQFGVGFDPRQAIGVQPMGLPQPIQAPQAAPQPQQGFWQGGGKFGTKDALAAALAVIGDVASQQSGGQAGATGMLVGNRFNAMDLARKEREDALRRQRERQEGLQDYTAKREIDQRFETPGSNIEIREDNAGNVWHFDKRTGMPIGQAPAWIDKAPKQYMQDGMLINVPNPFLQGQAGAAPPAITAQDWEKGVPVGGGAGNGAGTFRFP